MQCRLVAVLGSWLSLSGALTLSAQAFPQDKPASVRSLPADNLPPFGMLDENGHLVAVPVADPGALQHGPGSLPESRARGPSLDLASQAARAAIDACAAAGYRVGAAVIDAAGEARAMLTADGSDGSHVFVAMRKAETALRLGMASSRAEQQVATDRELRAKVTPDMFVAGGAVPIWVGRDIVGAIGVSGAGGAVIGQQDERCAVAGLERIRERVK